MSSQPYHRFPNTHWSLVRRAGTGDSEVRRQAMSILLHRYEPALKSYLRVVRRLGDGADDVLQAFVADKLLEREMLRHADEGRGRFRTFLLTSLNNFLTSLQRSQGSASRGGAPQDAAAGEPEGRRSGQSSPAAQVEAAWARALVRDVLTAMREKCLADGRMDVWAIFEGRILAEVFEDRRPVSYEDLSDRLGLASPTQAANLLVTGKRLYGRLLRVAISEYERGDAQIEAEIADLRAILSRGSADLAGAPRIEGIMNETADFQHSRVEHLEPAKLARLLAADAAADSWNGEDPAVILGHQLRAPLLPDLLMVPGTEEARLRALVHGRPGAGSFVDQLTFVHPSLELLQAIKDFARHVCGDADNPLHGSPANVLYFAAIAAAIARCDARISRLPDHELREGFSWALQQPAAGPLAAVLLAGLEKLLTTDH